MKTGQTTASSSTPVGFPDADSLAALRGWYAGLSSRAAVEHYLAARKAAGQSARGMLGHIRRQLIVFANSRHRPDLADVFQHAPEERQGRAGAVERAIRLLPTLPAPKPQISDSIDQWLSPRTVRALQAYGIHTLSALTVRIPRRRGWWKAIEGLGMTGARQVEAFFAAHPQLTERARALIPIIQPSGIVPWEQLRLPNEVDGSQGNFRPAQRLHAECDQRLRGRAGSAGAARDCRHTARLSQGGCAANPVGHRRTRTGAIIPDHGRCNRVPGLCPAPDPRERWVGPPRPRDSVEWRPFSGGLSARSAAYALTVLSALFRWLIEQRYVLANPFAGVKVRGHALRPALDTARGFTEGEWLLLRAIADGLEWSYGWSEPAAQRLRFMLDFGYATGLRASELVGAVLGNVRLDEHGDHWLHLVGKGGKPGKVALPPLAYTALDQYLAQRQLPVSRERWNPKTPLVGSLGEDGNAGITGPHLWCVLRRFFTQAAEAIEADHPVAAEKLRRATPH